ncbi:MAG: amino acid permease [bacterium]
MKSNSTNNGLDRKLGPFPLTNIVIANMIGTGIFTTSGLLMQNLHHPVLMIGLWIAAGIIALSGALCYGQLGASFPQAGGEYIFLSRLYHPIFGFLTGWVSFYVGFSAPIAAAGIASSSYFLQAFPQITERAAVLGIHDPGLIQKILALSIIIIFTVVHLHGVRFGARVQNVLTLLKIIFIICLLLFGFSLGKGNLSHFHQSQAFTLDLSGWKMIGLSLMWILFAFSGWNAVTYIGSEVKDPKRNTPLSLLLGTGVVTVLYVLLNILYVYAVPPAEMEGVIPVGGLTVKYLFGSSLETFFSLFIALALLSSISAFIILGPRIYYAMAKEGYFFRFAARVNPSSHVPSLSIVIQGILASVMILTGTFDQILTYMGFSLGIFPILAVFSVFKLKKQKPDTFFLPAFPLPPLLYGSVSIAILILAYMQRPLESSLALGVVLVGIPIYLIFKKRKSNNK